MNTSAGPTFQWEHVLYRFRDVEGALLYVGITNDIKRRFAQHAMAQKWWAQVDSCAVEFYPTRDAAADAEHKAIHAEFPLYNERLTRSVHPVPGVQRKAATPKPARVSPTTPVRVRQFNPDMPNRTDLAWLGDGNWRATDGQIYPSYVLMPAPAPKPGMDAAAYRAELMATGATEAQATAAVDAAWRSLPVVNAT